MAISKNQAGQPEGTGTIGESVPENLLYRVVFVNQQQIYELYAKREADAFGFVVIEDFAFGENRAIVIDPGEERLKTEAENITRSYAPMHETVHIDQVERRGTAKIIPLQRDGAGSEKASKFMFPDGS